MRVNPNLKEIRALASQLAALQHQARALASADARSLEQRDFSISMYERAVVY